VDKSINLLSKYQAAELMGHMQGYTDVPKKAAKFSSTVASLFTFQPAINKSSTVTHAQERLLVSQV
jgi:hypothetical protein